MAEVTAMRNNATPYPLYGLPYVVSFPLLDADGDPISPSSPDSEISKNGDTFADCTNEATEIATSSGICYLSLTGTELTTDLATVQIKSTGAKTTVLTLYPRKLVSIRAGTSASGGVSTSTIVLDGSASAIDDFYNGMVVAAVIDGTTEVRTITDYAGGTRTATVVPDWNTAPDNNDTFTIYRPDGVQIQQANTTVWNSTTQAAAGGGYPSVNVATMNGTGVNSYINTWNATNDRLAGIVPNYGTVGSTGNDTTHVHLSTVNAGGDDELNNMLLLVFDEDESEYHSRWIEDWAASTQLATVAALPFTPAGGSDVFYLLPIRRDVLSATRPEPAQGTPAATTDPLTKIDYLYKAWRNKKTQTSSQYSLYADDASTVDHKASVSDDGTTLTVGEVASGP